jgi:phosphoserine phosphatase RsbU/P
MNVLIADDDDTCRAMLQAFLKKCGYDVAAARDGREAWEMLQTPDAPRLAVIDWMMPEMNGPDLCRKLRSQESTRPLYIILLTSKGEQQDIIAGLEAGADDYIAKPYDQDELKARMNAGRRIIQLQLELIKKQKLQGVLEMAGAVCHELNQPLQSVSGFAELLIRDLRENDPNKPRLEKIKAEVDRIGILTRKIMNIANYRTREYLRGTIIDIDQSSETGE